jgi:dolichol-phosphate mannosyltransferase
MPVSVVIPVFNEAANVALLAREVFRALQGSEFELIFVDDASTDDTAAEVRRAQAELGARVVLARHHRNAGQSAALHTGFRVARHPWVVTLDGDGQNDPADVPRLLILLQKPGFDSRVKLIAGERLKRQDNRVRRLSSGVANAVRRAVLSDGISDTGCGLKLIERECFLNLPYFDHMHRFIPALVQQSGGHVLSLAVNHRPRHLGRSKYGIWNRLFTGLVDLAGVAWLGRRNRHPPWDVERSESPHGFPP